MKKFRILTAFLLLIMIHAAVHAESVVSMFNGAGYIEVVSGSHMEKIFLPSGKSERIEIASDYIVDDFDVSRDEKKRVIAITDNGKFKLLNYENDQQVHTIISNVSIRKPVFSPNGTSFVYLRIGDKSEKPRKDRIQDWYLYFAKSDGSDNKQLSDLGLARFKPSWFPDGKSLVLSTKDYKIYILDKITNQEQKIVDFGYAPTVSNDGTKIAYLSHDIDESIKKRIIAYSRLTVGEYKKIITSKNKEATELTEIELYQIKHSIYIYDIAKRTSKKLTEELWVEEPAVWSPNDRYLIYNDRKAVNNKIFILDVNTGAREQLLGKEGRIMVWR